MPDVEPPANLLEGQWGFRVCRVCKVLCVCWFAGFRVWRSGFMGLRVRVYRG